MDSEKIKEVLDDPERRLTLTILLVAVGVLVAAGIYFRD